MSDRVYTQLSKRSQVYRQKTWSLYYGIAKKNAKGKHVVEDLYMDCIKVSPTQLEAVDFKKLQKEVDKMRLAFPEDLELKFSFWVRRF